MLKGLTLQTVGSWVPTPADEEHEENVCWTWGRKGWQPGGKSLQVLPAMYW